MSHSANASIAACRAFPNSLAVDEQLEPIICTDVHNETFRTLGELDYLTKMKNTRLTLGSGGMRNPLCREFDAWRGIARTPDSRRNAAQPASQPIEPRSLRPQRRAGKPVTAKILVSSKIDACANGANSMGFFDLINLISLNIVKLLLRSTRP